VGYCRSESQACLSSVRVKDGKQDLGDTYSNHSGENVGREDFVSWREIEICRYEKEIAECKLKLARHEIAFLRERQDMHSMNREHQKEAIASGGDDVATLPHPRSNLTAIADLLDFDGNFSNIDTWERQVSEDDVYEDIGK